jgi:hypothetical protein
LIHRSAFVVSIRSEVSIDVASEAVRSALRNVGAPAPAIAGMIEQGTAAMKRTLERAAGRPPDLAACAH